MPECIFCKIAKKEQKAEIIYENDRIVAFPDINPIAPLHILIIPKKHISSIQEMEGEDRGVVGEMIWVAKEIAERKGVRDQGYKLVIRCGEGGGQEVAHVHLHLLSGKHPLLV